MLAPMLVQLEREIDREIAAEQRAFHRGNSLEDTDEEEEEEEYGPMPQIVTNDLKSLDEMVSTISCLLKFILSMYSAFRISVARSTAAGDGNF